MAEWAVEIDNNKIFTKHALKDAFDSLGLEQPILGPKVTEEGMLLYTVNGPDDINLRSLPEGVVDVKNI